MRSVRIVVAFLALGLPAVTHGQDSSLARLVVPSARLHEDRQVFVVTPPGYQSGAARYPVLVLLDADDRDQFALARANVAFLAGRNAIPQLILVGVPNTKDRTHDLTPKATGPGASRFPTAGGADAFADFITQDLLPTIRAKYRTNAATVLAGHSFGGLFAIHVAATRPGAFSGVIAMSPSMWWNDSTPVVTYADAIAKATATQRLFATSGGLEPPIDVTAKRFASRMDSLKPRATAFAYRFYAEDTHGLTPAPSLTDGLRFVFRPVSLTALPINALGPTSDSAAVVNAVLKTESDYAAGARSLGLPEQLPENVLNQLGYNVLRGLHLPSVAVWVFRRNVEKYPESANVYDSFGDGLLALGDTASAKTQFRKAVDVATRSGDPILAESREKLAKLSSPVQAGAAKP